MLIECHRCRARVDAVEIGCVERNMVDDLKFDSLLRTYLLRCPCCGCALIGEVEQDIFADEGTLVWCAPVRVHPKPRRRFSYEVPEPVRRSLEEAEACWHGGAYLAAAAMAGRALEAICRHFSTDETYIGAGIKELHNKGIIDSRLLQWSEELRDQRNLAAHATDTTFSSEDSGDLLTFTTAITEYIFILSMRFRQFQSRKAKKAKQHV